MGTKYKPLEKRVVVGGGGAKREGGERGGDRQCVVGGRASTGDETLSRQDARPGGRIGLPLLYVAGVWAASLLGTAFAGVCAWRVGGGTRLRAQALAGTELVLAR